MNKKILNEISEMKYFFGYKRGVVISEQVSEPEQRAQNAYKLMIDGAAGWGTDPKKIDQPLTIPAPDTPPAAPEAKTAAAVVDNWEDVKKYYKDNQNVDPKPSSAETETYETLTVTENGRTYILYSDENTILGKDNKWSRGNWSWDGTKPIFSFFKTTRKETTGYVNDSDTSWEVVTDKKKVMGLGSSGHLVKKLQTALILNGYADGLIITDDMEGCKEDSGKCDGIYGKGTRDAVKKAQEDLELDVDGIVGSETYEAMSNV